MRRRAFLVAAAKTAVVAQVGGTMAVAEGIAGAATTASPRVRLSLDEGWKFRRGDFPGAEAPGFDDKDWQTVDVPHDWSIEGPFAKDNPGAQRVGYLPSGTGWYRRELTVAAGGGRNVRVEFDGVYRNSDVWLNGHHLGLRPYGYSSFEYDLTPFLNAGGTNVLAVRVDNSKQPNSRYYSGSGIYRHVWLHVTGPVCVDHWGTFVTTPAVASDGAVVKIAVQVRNAAGESGKVVVRNSIFGADGTEVARAEKAVALAGATSAVEHEIHVARPKLWTPDEPHMYVARTTVLRDGHVVDVYETPFGIRRFEFDADKGFSLNGRGMKLQGVCLHHDLGALGAAFSEAASERRLRLLKAMGCNAIRMAHNPPAPQLLDLCDRMGFLVIDEAFDEWSVGKEATPEGYHLDFKEWGERDLRDMVLRDRNHPSIILWSIGNEIPDKGQASGVETCKALSKVVRELDPTRPVTAAVNNIQAANKSGYADVLDVVGYNGGGNSSAFYDSDHAQYPRRKMYGSEVPHTAQTRGVYASTATHCSSYGEAFVEMSYEQSWRKTNMRPFFAGEFRWVSFDYLGEPTRHVAFHIPAQAEDARWPLRSSEAGVIDMCGFPKDAYYFYQSQWTRKPMVHLLPHWTWPDKMGETISVWCYSNCDAVELFVNEKSVGRKSFEAEGPVHLAWPVAYAPGKIRAVGFRGGVEVCREEIRTEGKAAKIVLTAERAEVRADGRDLVYVDAAVTDADGVMVPDADQRIRFEVSGPGRLVAVDNGDTASHESFQGDTMAAFSGMCVAVVRGTKVAGTIHVTASAKGLQAGSVSVLAR